jgi:hypothetical protein
MGARVAATIQCGAAMAVAIDVAVKNDTTRSVTVKAAVLKSPESDPLFAITTKKRSLFLSKTRKNATMMIC